MLVMSIPKKTNPTSVTSSDFKSSPKRKIHVKHPQKSGLLILFWGWLSTDETLLEAFQHSTGQLPEAAINLSIPCARYEIYTLYKVIAI